MIVIFIRQLGEGSLVSTHDLSIQKQSEQNHTLQYTCPAAPNSHGYFRASPVAQMVKSLPAMQETRAWSLVWDDLLEEEMANRSSILAWRIPWTEEPGEPQSLDLQRVGHNWATNTSFHILQLKKIILYPIPYNHSYLLLGCLCVLGAIKFLRLRIRLNFTSLNYWPGLLWQGTCVPPKQSPKTQIYKDVTSSKRR